jgi:Zn-dependent protease with chaperone function
MSVAAAVLTNLLFNTLAAFWVSLALSLLLFRAAHLQRSALGVGVLLLPFVKVALETLRGVPAASFLWLSARGVRQSRGEFRIGFGATPGRPHFVAELWARHAGGRAPESAGDLLVRFLRAKLGEPAVPALAFAVLAVSLGGFALFLLRRARAAREARAWAERGALVERRRSGRRVVRVVDSPEYRGAPFAAGLRAPFVLLPRGLRERLHARELEAVLAHELAHVRRFDLVVLLALEAFAKLFWYVPGVAFARRRVAALLERRADDAALAAGVAPAVLARALLLTAELTQGAPASPHPCVTGARSELAGRVRRLLDDARTPPSFEDSRRARAAMALLRSAAVIWWALGILGAVVLGNHAG